MWGHRLLIVISAVVATLNDWTMCCWWRSSYRRRLRTSANTHTHIQPYTHTVSHSSNSTKNAERPTNAFSKKPIHHSSSELRDSCQLHCLYMNMKSETGIMLMLSRTQKCPTAIDSTELLRNKSSMRGATNSKLKRTKRTTDTSAHVIISSPIRVERDCLICVAFIAMSQLMFCRLLTYVVLFISLLAVVDWLLLCLFWENTDANNSKWMQHFQTIVW